MHVIYMIEFENKSAYIGCTNNLKRRIREHKCKSNKGFESPLYKTMREFNFKFIVKVIHENIDDLDKCASLEIESIIKYRYLGLNLLNISVGGGGIGKLSKNWDSSKIVKKNKDLDILYNIKKSCQLLCVSKDTLYDWNKLGKIEFIKVGDFNKVSENEIKRIRGGK